MLRDSIPKKSFLALMFSICILVATSEQLSATSEKSMDYKGFVLGELVVPEPDGTLSFAPGALERFQDEYQLKMIATQLAKINKDIQDGKEAPFVCGDTRLFETTGPLFQDETGRWFPWSRSVSGGRGITSVTRFRFLSAIAVPRCFSVCSAGGKL